MASASEAELLIVVDNLFEFIAENLSLLETKPLPLSWPLFVSDRLQKLKEWIEGSRGKLDKLVISSIREFLQEVEEAMETCVVQGLMIKRKTQMQSTKEDLLRMRIEDILLKFRQLLEDFDRIGSKLFRISNKNDQRWNDKALFVVDDYQHTVGCGDEIEKVLSLVIKFCNVGDGNFGVIWITGMAGLGKTEVAGRVFKYGMLRFMFSLRAFIFVPRDYSKNKEVVFIEILRQLGKEEEFSGTADTELPKMLGDILNSSSFFIVLDNVGSPEVLVDIKRSMDMAAAASQQQGNQQSKSKGVLLITARGRKPAMEKEMGYSNKNDFDFDLRLLEPKESKELLRMETFGKNECPVEFEQCETKIVEKCYGLPLAVVSFARILTKHLEKIEWWKKVADNVNVFTEESQINKAIRSIFEELNDNLKLCFLYLGVFERGAHIPVSVLLRLWMAEGLVRKKELRQGILTEEVADSYLKELVERSLVMVSKRRSNGKIKAIKIHDGVLDFCISEAKEGGNVFKESFLSGTSGRFCIRDPETVSKQYYGRNLMTKPSPLRSILHISSSSGQMNLSNSKGRRFSFFLSSFVPKTFKFLRVMDVRSFELTKLPAQLFSLFLLRYMAISCNSSFLPKELSNLCYLETLIVRTSSESETLEIRADILDMALLGHINSNKPVLVKQKSTNNNNKPVVNQNLQTISEFSHKSCTKEFFQRTPYLKKLAISFYYQEPDTPNTKKWSCFGKCFGGNGNHKQQQQEEEEEEVRRQERQLQQQYLNFFEHLAELNNLENLKVLNYGSHLKYPLPLESHSFPKRLKNLTLLNTYLDRKNMIIIGKMSNLETLKLQFSEFEGNSWETEDDGFLKLKFLHLSNTNLHKWCASWNHFPMLTSLFLFRCHNLEILPDGLSDMQTLQTVMVNYGLSTLATSLKTVFSNKLKTQLGFKLNTEFI